MESSRVFLKNLSIRTSPESLKSFLSRYGVIQQVHIKHNRYNGESFGFGSALLDNEETIQIILKQSLILDGNQIEVTRMPLWKNVEDPSCSSPSQENHSPNLNIENKYFIQQLGADTTEKDIYDYFSKFGVVSNVCLRAQKTLKRGKGYALVIFEEGQRLKELIENHEHIIKGTVCRAHIYFQQQKPGIYSLANEKCSININSGLNELDNSSLHDSRFKSDEYGKVISAFEYPTSALPINAKSLRSDCSGKLLRMRRNRNDSLVLYLNDWDSDNSNPMVNLSQEYPKGHYADF